LKRAKSIISLVIVIGLLLVGALRWTELRQAQAVVTDTRFMMNTMVTIKIIGEREDKALAAMEEAFFRIREVEEALSAYLDRSDIALVNEAAGKEYVPVSHHTLKVLGESIGYAQLTEGAFDPSIGPLISLWGFDTGEAKVPDDKGISRTLPHVDYRKVRMDKANNRVMLAEPGMRLDLGGAAKGYAVDVAAQILIERDIGAALIDAGMSSIRVIGSKPSGQSWAIGVGHPRQTEKYLGVIPLLGGQALGTSGDYQQYFVRDGKRYSHIIDPRTGLQPEGLASVTILAPNGLEADILSTAVFVLGPIEGMALVEELDGVEAVMVTEEGKVLVSPGLQGRFKAK
jgi:thiamine biosynthesis lipoprotein